MKPALGSSRSRRSVLIGAGAVAGLLVAIAVMSWWVAPYALPEADFSDIAAMQDRFYELFTLVMPACALVGLVIASRRSSLATRASLIALLAACVVAGAAFYFPFTNDDAYIFARYAQNLASGQGLVFNPGDRVEGVSSLAWTAILALFELLGAHPMMAGKLLGVAMACGSAALIFDATERMTNDARAAFLAALLFASDQHVLSWVGSGMDVSIFVFWILALATSTLRDGRGVSWRTTAIATVGWWVRPEAAAMIGLAGIAALVHQRRAWRAVLPHVGVVLLGLAALMAFRLLYFERWAPNTYFAKVYLATQRSAADWFAGLADYWTLPFIGLGLAGLWALRRHTGWLLAAIVVLSVHLWRAGGDILSIRFGVFLFAPLLLGVGRVFAAIGTRRLGVLGAALLFAALAYPTFERMSGARELQVWSYVAEEYVPWNSTTTFQVDYQAARYVAARSEPDDLLVADNIGVIGYYGRIRMFDTYGLTNRRVADRIYADRQVPDLHADIAALEPRWILCGPSWDIFGARELRSHVGGAYVEVQRWSSPLGWSRVLLERRPR